MSDTPALPSEAPRPYPCFKCGKMVRVGKLGLLMHPTEDRSHDCGEGWMEEHGYADAPAAVTSPPVVAVGHLHDAKGISGSCSVCGQRTIDFAALASSAPLNQPDACELCGATEGPWVRVRTSDGVRCFDAYACERRCYSRKPAPVAVPVGEIPPQSGVFVKKPIPVHAFQWFPHQKDGGGDGWGALDAWLVSLGYPSMDDANDEDDASAMWLNDDLLTLTIPTLEGDHRCDVGDWIIRGIRGEFYPCKPDIFAESYEPAPAATPSSGAPAIHSGGATAGEPPEIPFDEIAAIDYSDDYEELLRVSRMLVEFEPNSQYTRVGDHVEALIKRLRAPRSDSGSGPTDEIAERIEAIARDPRLPDRFAGKLFQLADDVRFVRRGVPSGLCSKHRFNEPFDRSCEICFPVDSGRGRATDELCGTCAGEGCDWWFATTAASTAKRNATAGATPRTTPMTESRAPLSEERIEEIRELAQYAEILTSVNGEPEPDDEATEQLRAGLDELFADRSSLGALVEDLTMMVAGWRDFYIKASRRLSDVEGERALLIETSRALNASFVESESARALLERELAEVRATADACASCRNKRRLAESQRQTREAIAASKPAAILPGEVHRG